MRMATSLLTVMALAAGAGAFEVPPIEDARPVAVPAPDFKLGEKSFREEYKGKVVLLDFWFIDCPWCLKSTPRLNELRKKFGEKGLSVVGLNIDQGEAAARAQRYAQESLAYPTFYGAAPEARLYGVASYPTFVLVGPDGALLARGGYAELHGEEWSRLIESALPKAAPMR